MPKVRTIYNPGVAMVYVIKNTRTGETANAATCGIKDVDFKPWRSPKGTPKGQEFFKMKLGSKKDGFKSITFLNSSMQSSCISDDGEWEFIGIRPDGGTIPKLTDPTPINNKKSTVEYAHLSKKVKTSIEKVNNNELNVNKNQIHATIQNEEFVDMTEMNKILN